MPGHATNAKLSPSGPVDSRLGAFKYMTDWSVLVGLDE
jgi:hypothetical protein